MQIIVVILLCLTLYSKAEEVITENIEIKTENSKNVEISTTEKSFMSKLSSWIFPFGSTDDTATAETRRIGTEYLPPSNHHDVNCNPCNKEPWIPVAANYGKNTLIGFVQPSEFDKQIHLGNGGSYLQTLHSPKAQFREYGPPPVNIPSNNYRSPLQIPYGPPKPTYNAPQSIYNTPQQTYNAPQQTYNAPQKTYNVPQKTYNAPQPDFNGSPPTFNLPQSTYNIPNNRRPKLPPIKFVPKQNVFPSPNFGPSGNQYLPPSQARSPTHHYLTEIHPPPLRIPNTNNIQSSHRVNSKYKPYIPIQHYGPPLHQKPSQLPSNVYLPGKPSINYGHPIQNNIQHQRPPFPPLPPSNNYISPTQSSNQYLPAAVPSDSYGKPLHGSDAELASVLKSESVNNEYIPSIEPVPQPSTHGNYPQHNQIHHPFIHKPIPFPNLSSLPVLPLHNPQNFHSINTFEHANADNHHFGNLPPDNYIQQTSGIDNIAFQNAYVQDNVNTNIDHGTNVEIIKSVPIAGYLATIEHPINVIQSPIVDVAASAFNEGTFLENIDHSSNNNNNNDNNKQQEVNLSENPIVVEDTHASATSNNATVVLGVNQKRNNDKDLNVYVNIKDISSTIAPTIKEVSQNIQEINLFNPELVNSIIESNDVNKLTTNNTIEEPSSKIDWNDYAQELLTSMKPPPKGESPWLSSIKGTGRIISTTTKTPKQIQIIIPYITNHKPTPFKSGQTTNIPTFNSGVHRYNNHIQTSTHKSPKFTHPAYSTSAFKIGNNQKELPMYTIPPTSESVWLQHTDHVESDSNIVTQTAQHQSTTKVTNIRDLIEANSHKYNQNKPTFDVAKLQKHIDNWTEQEYSKNLPYINYDKVSTVSKFVPSKIIPEEYLTTPSYNSETTTTKSTTQYDYFSSSINKDLGTTYEDLQSNLILSDTTTATQDTTLNEDNLTTPTKVLYGTIHNVNDTKPSWDKLKIDNSSKEKIYVVTPQPVKYGFSVKNFDNKRNISFSSDKFAISLDKLHSDTNKTDLKIVLSEWPHLSKCFIH